MSNETAIPGSFWQRRVVQPILAQLRQGITPEKLALTLALGLTLAMFPVLGTTSILCFLAGLAFRLNQPVIQLVNWLAYPLQLSLLLVFIRLGEKLCGASPVPFSIPDLMARFKQAPGKFLAEFGMTGLHGILGWGLVALVLVPGLYYGLLPLLRKLRQNAD